jgi:glycosyltransferase involved in cell wall biosynthesis
MASTEASASATITACIIARDEARSLPDCLASVAFCQEIVLVDSGSSDETVAIARAAGARVIEQPWLGFAAQRNVALGHARGTWVLEIDADERVSPRLRAEMEAFVADPPAGVTLAGLPLREIFLGRSLGPSAKYPKYRHRLLLRGAHRHDERRTVHEGLVPDGPVHPFEGDLIHLLAAGWGEALGDAWRYARLEAGQLQARRNAAAVLKGAILRPSAKLVYRLLIDGGWRDGWAGAAKIAIDCATDSVVWLRYAAGRHGHERGESGVEADLHYGAWKIRRGSLRVVALAGDSANAAAAASWLARAAALGADVSLLSTSPPPAEEVRVRRLQSFGPLAVIRGLEAEEQLRTLDAVIAFGRRASLMLHAVPHELRGHVRDLTPELDPAAVHWDGSDRREPVPA